MQVGVWPGDLTGQPPPEVDLIAAGNTFYAAALAADVCACLIGCHAAGVSVLIRDPGGAHMPVSYLREVVRYPVRDFGHSPDDAPVSGVVFALTPAQPAEAAVP